MSLDWLPGLDLSNGTFTLPLWAVAVALALFVALIVIAVLRAGLTELGSMIFRVAVILIAVVFGWTYMARTGERDRMDERRALDARAIELAGRAITPGSAIACLEATNTETVEGSCERAVFASPETVAAATTYMAARLSLLADAHDYVARRDQGYESQIAGLRRTVAADRYGLASQVLATREGCTADMCDAFSHVYDDKKLKANLRDRLFDITVARYAAGWPTRSRPVALGGPAAAPVPMFPSAQSMAPVTSPSVSPAPSQSPGASAEPAQQPPAVPSVSVQEPAPVPPTNSAPASATKRAAPSTPPRAAAKNTAPPPMSLNPTAKQ